MNPFSTPPWPDAVLYDTVARDFAQTGLFRYKIWGDFDPSYLLANFNNGPLYPALHLVLLKSWGSTDHRILVALNLLFMIGSLWNIGRALQFKGRQWALLLIIMASPPVLNYVGVVRPEFLNIFLFTCIWRLLSPLPTGGEGACPPPAEGKGVCTWRPLLAGICLGLAALTHQFAVFFIPPTIYFLYGSRSHWRGRLRNAGILVTGTLICLAPYIHYICTHWADFRLQLLRNQMGESVSGGIGAFIRSFLVPLFYPSISVFTLTGRIPRWFADGLPIAMVFAAVALVAKWRRHVPISPASRTALAVWLSMNVGCAVTTFSPYVTFFFVVFVVALLRDVFPNFPKALRTGILVAALMGITHQIILAGWVEKKLFRREDYQTASACVAQNLPAHARVYVMAYPDPSNALLNRRPDIDIRRYIDFSRYQAAWEATAKTDTHFVVSGDGNFLNRFDHGGALRQEIADNHVHPLDCTSGNIQFILYTRH